MSNLVEMRVPDIGDFKDVPVVEIYVAVGDIIEVDDTVVALESDKATLDVPSTLAGCVTEVRVSEGDIVSEGSVVLVIEAVAKPAATSSTSPPGENPIVTAPSAVPAQLDPAKEITNETIPHASPTVRKIARELGVKLASVIGTGPKDRITKEDVHGFVKQALSAPQKTGTGGQYLLPWPKVDFAKFGPVERKPLSRIAKISGPSLARNSAIIPHVTNFEETNVTELEAFRKQINAEAKDGQKLSILPFVVKACVSALKTFPDFNSSLEGDKLVLKQYWNIGVAADTPDGLVVPVIKEADRKGIRDIATEMSDLASDARNGKLKSKDIQGATFTISSLGGIGGTNFTPIINAPEVAILGMTRASIKPHWDGQAFQPQLIQPLSLSWDHRVVDGVAAARFLVVVKEILADFRRISL